MLRTIRTWAVGTAAVVLTLLAPSTASAELTVFMDGLNSPRGLAFNGTQLFVAEAGVGGGVPIGAITTTDDYYYYGLTGRVSTRDITGGPQWVYVQGLPSLANSNGSDARGPRSIAFDSEGVFHLMSSFGADPAIRQAEPLASQPLSFVFASILRQEANTLVHLMDVGAFEQDHNPDNGAVVTNPTDFVILPDGWMYITDAGGNTLLGAHLNLGVTGSVVIPYRPNPLDFGPPVFPSVPTGLAVVNDTVYIAELTGYPFPTGHARVLSYDGSLDIHAAGLSALIDLAVDADGTLYALSFDANGILNPGSNGGLYRINPDGSADLLLSDGLISPGGLAIGPDGAFYISIRSDTPGGGQVVRFAIPEPTGLGLLAGAGILLMRRHRAAVGADTTRPAPEARIR